MGKATGLILADRLFDISPGKEAPKLHHRDPLCLGRDETRNSPPVFERQPSAQDSTATIFVILQRVDANT